MVRRVGTRAYILPIHLVSSPIRKLMPPSSPPAQVALIDPGSFRVIDDLLQKEVKGPKKIETMSFAAVEDDGRIE